MRVSRIGRTASNAKIETIIASILALLTFASMVSTVGSMSAFAAQDGVDGIEDSADGDKIEDQYEEDFGPVNGTFVNNHVGLEITFPEGWNGRKFFGWAIVGPEVGPNGMTGGGSVNASMTVIVFGGGIVFNGSQAESFAPGNFLDFLEKQINSASESCESISAEFTEVSGISALRVNSDNLACDNYFRPLIVEGYVFVNNNHLVVVVFAAYSEESHDKYYDEFRNSLSSLRLNDARDFKEGFAELVGVESNQYSVRADGNDVELNVQSSSEITRLDFSEENKLLAITTETHPGETGTTIIPVGDVLEGPYVVTVDGNKATDYAIVNDSGRDYLYISHKQDTHEIAISGTNVVPEFPVSITAVIAGVIATIVLVARAQLFGSLGNRIP